MNKHTVLIALSLFITGCSSLENADSGEVGGYLDEHGCLPSGGYEWSILQENCMRLWEQETISLSAVSEEETGSIELLFSDDRKTAEIFMINGDNIIVKQTSDGSWRDVNGNFRLARKADGLLQMFSGDNLVAAEKLSESE